MMRPVPPFLYQEKGRTGGIELLFDRRWLLVLLARQKNREKMGK